MNHYSTSNRWHVQRLSKVQRQDIHPGTTNNNNTNQDDDSSDDNDYNNALPGAYAVSRGGRSEFPISPWEDGIANNVNIVDSSSSSATSLPSLPTTRRESMLSNRIVERHEDVASNHNIDNDPLRRQQQQQQLEENLEMPQYYGIEKGQSKYRVGRVAAIIGILVFLVILIIALTLVLTMTLSTPIVTLDTNDETEQNKTNVLCGLDPNSILQQCNSGVLDIPPCAETTFQELSIMLLNGTNHSNIQHPMYPCDTAHFGLLALAVAKVNDVNNQMDDIQQYWILAIVFFALGGGQQQQQWRQDQNWLTGNSPCNGNWYGISCSLEDGTNMVESIDLMYNNIVGTFPIEITALHSIRTLNLNGGDVTGTLPPEIGNMANLTFLYLEDTNLNGSLPTEIGLCQSLKYLNVLRADISGLIPTEIGQLSQLEYLGLPSKVNDTLPTEIGSLSRLQVLQLVDMENLRGGIPSEFQNLSSLTQLNVARSMYDEISFSSFLNSLPTTLVSLELESCGFQGSISQHIAAFQNMTTLKLVNLNSITGTIPSEIGLMTRLQRIELENLIIYSMVPSEIGKLTQLTYLSLQDSRVTTILPSEIMQLTGLQIIPPGGDA